MLCPFYPFHRYRRLINKLSSNFLTGILTNCKKNRLEIKKRPTQVPNLNAINELKPIDLIIRQRYDDWNNQTSYTHNINIRRFKTFFFFFYVYLKNVHVRCYYYWDETFMTFPDLQMSRKRFMLHGFKKKEKENFI